MKLIQFRIQNYKTIDRTDLVPADPAVTALVGKNESGKTAVLRSLWKSKNVAGKKFDKLLDYPRDRYSKDRRGRQPVVSLELGLTEEESSELLDEFPDPSPSVVDHVTVTTFYAGEDNTETEVTFDASIESLAAKVAPKIVSAIDDILQAVLDSGHPDDSGIATAADKAKQALAQNPTAWKPDIQQTLTQLDQALNNWQTRDGNRPPKIAPQRPALMEASKLIAQGEPFAPARRWIIENMPAFIYFDDYGQLETRIHLPAYLKRKGSNPDQKTRTQTALFEHSGLDPKEILDLGQPKQGNETDEQVQRRKDKRRALLDSASFGLTGEWTRWWSEKRHKLHFDADGEDLVLKVSDEHNEFPIPFEERSQGFQWFFSFYLVFLVESEKAHKGAILLLDEPGLHLHPTLQAKLTALFDRISQTNQLIYSTHLPFLIAGNHLERVRTIHLSGEEPQKTVVSNNVRPTGDSDTLFPLQAALGYSIAQTLFLGKRSLVVEGITDYWILKALNEAIGATGSGTVLHPDTVIIPAGGTSRLMPLASILFGSAGLDGRNLLVLLDDDNAGKDAAKRLLETFSGTSNVLLLRAATGSKVTTIEDLFPRASYVEALMRVGHAVSLNAAEQKTVGNVEAMEKAFQRLHLGTFGQENKARVALALIDQIAKDPKSVAKETKEQASRLFAAVNRQFEPK